MNYAINHFGRTCAPLLALALVSAGCTDDGSEGAESGSSSSTSGPDTSGSSTASQTGVEPTTTGSESSSGTESSSSGASETGSTSGSDSGGSDSTGAPSGAFEEPRTYESYWTMSEEQCAQQMKQGSNCSYLVSFCPDGRSAVVWSDIVGAGTYTLDGTSVDAQWRDVRFASATFEYDPESDTLQDSVFSQTWERSLEFSLLTCD